MSNIKMRVNTISYLSQNNCVYIYDVSGKLKGPFKSKQLLRITRKNLTYNIEASWVLPGDIVYLD